MPFTYVLIPGGFQVLQDGQLVLDQPFAPGEPGLRALTPEEAQILAEEALVAYNTPAPAETPA